MTDDQRDTLNRFLTTKVLGGIERDGITMVNHGGVRFVPDFSTLADCELLLDKIEKDNCWWDWQRGEEGRYWFVVEKHSKYYEEKGASRTEALCLAIARCYGWKETEHGIG